MNQLSRCKALLGTFVSVDVIADASDESLLAATDKAFHAISLVQKCFSYHDVNSELSQLNAAAHIRPRVVSRLFSSLLGWCLQLSKDSGGLFDVAVAPLLVKDRRLPDHWPDEGMNVASCKATYESIELSAGRVAFSQPMRLDFGGVAKGVAVDLALTAVIEQLPGCLVNVVVNAGGDLRVFDWDNQQIGVVNHKQQVINYEMKAAAIASSAGYYQQGASEVYHPHKRQVVPLQKTISVFAASCQWADALTKVACMDSSHPVLAQYDAQVLIS